MLRIGAGAGGVAMAQAAQAVDYLLSSEPEEEYQIVTVALTEDGATAQATPGAGFELTTALQQREIDLAVLAGDDLPLALPAGLCVAAVADRVTPHDVLVTRAGMTLAGLPPGARVAAPDARRCARLRHLRRDLLVSECRGEPGSQLQMLKDGGYEALLLGAAGLVRLNVREPGLKMTVLDELVPAGGQGMLILLARGDDEPGRTAAARLQLAEYAAALAAEQEFMRLLGNCGRAAVGVLAELDGLRLKIAGMVLAADGGEMVRDQCEGPLAEQRQVVHWLVERLKSKGAARLLAGA